MSLRPRWRLTSDSARSPSGATTATTTPESRRLADRPGWMKWTTITDDEDGGDGPAERPSQRLVRADGGGQRVPAHGRARPGASRRRRPPVTITAARRKAMPWRSGNRFGSSKSAANDPKTADPARRRRRSSVDARHRVGRRLDPGQVPDEASRRPGARAPAAARRGPCCRWRSSARAWPPGRAGWPGGSRPGGTRRRPRPRPSSTTTSR